MKTTRDVEGPWLSEGVHVTAWELPWSQPSPPRGAVRIKSGGALGSAGRSRFAAKASSSPLCVVSKAPEVVGKSVEVVPPVTYALPEASTAMEDPPSLSPPPRKVE